MIGWTIVVLLYVLGLFQSLRLYPEIIDHNPSDKIDRWTVRVMCFLWPLAEAYESTMGALYGEDRGND